MQKLDFWENLGLAQYWYLRELVCFPRACHILSSQVTCVIITCHWYEYTLHIITYYVHSISQVHSHIFPIQSFINGCFRISCRASAPHCSLVGFLVGLAKRLKSKLTSVRTIHTEQILRVTASNSLWIQPQGASVQVFHIHWNGLSLTQKTQGLKGWKFEKVRCSLVEQGTLSRNYLLQTNKNYQAITWRNLTILFSWQGL